MITDRPGVTRDPGSIGQPITPLGLTILRNELRDVDGLQVVGLDDLWAHRFQDAPKAIAQIDRDRAALVLTHNPDTVDMDAWGVPGLDFGGSHTKVSASRSSPAALVARGESTIRFNVRPAVTIHRLEAK